MTRSVKPHSEIVELLLKKKIRTRDAVPIAGVWRNMCSRPGCEFIEELPLAEGSQAPPCRHCCNPSELEFVSPLTAAHVSQVLEFYAEMPKRPPLARAR